MNATVTLPRTARALAVALFLASCGALAVAQPAAAPAKADDKQDKSKTPSESYIEKAAKAFASGKMEPADIENLKKAVEADPTLGTPRLVLARWLFEARKPQDGRQMLEQAIAEAPTHPEVYLLNGNVSLLEGRVADAILNLTRCQELALGGDWTPTMRKHFKDETNSGLAACYERRGNWPMAKRYLQDLDRDNPDNPGTLERLARCNFLLDQDSDAADNLRKAFEKNPQLDPPELRLGQLWAGRSPAADPDQKKVDAEIAKFREKAEDWFKRALAKYDGKAALGVNGAGAKAARDNAAKVYRGYADYLLTKGDTAAAKLQLQMVQQLDPNSRETKALEGLVARYEGRHADAAKLFEAARGISPSYAFAMANLALSLAESPDEADRKRAVEFADQYQKQNPQNADAYAVYGYCVLKLDDEKRLNEADQALSIPLRAGSVSPDTAYYIACLLNKRKNYIQARDILQKALKAENAPFVYRKNADELFKTVKPLADKEEAEKKKDEKKDDKKDKPAPPKG